jgi:hypothetical protein
VKSATRYQYSKRGALDPVKLSNYMVFYSKRGALNLYTSCQLPMVLKCQKKEKSHPPASHEKRKKRKTRAIQISGNIRIESTTGVHVLR